jgi:AAA domain-containing protein
LRAWPRSWLLANLLPDEGRLFIVAAPSAGKTFLAMVIANAAARVGRPVFMVLEEGGAGATAERFLSLGFDRDAPVHIAHLKGVALADRSMRARLTATPVAAPRKAAAGADSNPFAAPLLHSADSRNGTAGNPSQFAE